MFVSTYESGIDAKGRVSIPAPFRAALGGGSRVFLWPALDGSGCLEGGGEALMAVYRQTIMRLPPQSKAHRALRHGVFVRSADLKMDDAGRIRLPEHLMAVAGLGERVIFAGAVDSFQIWDPGRFSGYDAQMDDVVSDPDIAEALSAAYSETLAAGGVPGLGQGGGGGVE